MAKHQNDPFPEVHIDRPSLGPSTTFSSSAAPTSGSSTGGRSTLRPPTSGSASLRPPALAAPTLGPTPLVGADTLDQSVPQTPALQSEYAQMDLESGGVIVGLSANRDRRKKNFIIACAVTVIMALLLCITILLAKGKTNGVVPAAEPSNSDNTIKHVPSFAPGQAGGRAPIPDSIDSMDSMPPRSADSSHSLAPVQPSGTDWPTTNTDNPTQLTSGPSRTTVQPSGSTVTPSGASASPTHMSPYREVLMTGYGKCLEILDTYYDYKDVRLQQCFPSWDSQQWTYLPSTGQIQSSGHCLTVSDKTQWPPSEGTKLIAETCEEPKGQSGFINGWQKWYVLDGLEKYGYSSCNPSTGKCVSSMFAIKTVYAPPRDMCLWWDPSDVQFPILEVRTCDSTTLAKEFMWNIGNI